MSEPLEVVAALVARLEVLGQASSGAGLAVAFPGWQTHAADHTIFVVSRDPDRVEKLVRLIEQGGTPLAFLVVPREGRHAEVLVDPLPWAENGPPGVVEDYLTTLAASFVSLLVREGKASSAAVN